MIKWLNNKGDLAYIGDIHIIVPHKRLSVSLVNSKGKKTRKTLALIDKEVCWKPLFFLSISKERVQFRPSKV
jgi:hypothetical protein